MRTLKTLRSCLVLFLMMAFALVRGDEVQVFAASSLTDVLKEIAAGYEKGGGDKIVFNFAASNTLAMQIKAGAPADIFFSADEAKMDALAKEGLIAANTRKDLLSNTLVIVAFSYDSNQLLTSATQLADARFKKIAIGQPDSVPAGIYAKEYLTKIGIWDKVSARIVPCESVRATLAAVESGNVEAGIVYKTDAQHAKSIVVDYEVPVAKGPKITYPIAVVERAMTGDVAKHEAAVKKFMEYLSSSDSLEAFEKAGFIVKK